MSITFRYDLTEITAAILPKEILKNLVIVFSNISDPLDLNFDSTALIDYFGWPHKYLFVENPYICEEAKIKLSMELKTLLKF